MPSQVTFVDGGRCVPIAKKFHYLLLAKELGRGRSRGLTVAVHRLARGPIHNNMDRDPKIWGHNLGVAAKKAQDFLLGEGVWDL